MTTPTVNPQQRISQVVLDHPECVPVLQRNRIDFCCEGQSSLAAACEAGKLPLDRVLDELQEAISERQQREDGDPREMSTEALLRHIVARHHQYLRRTLPYVGGLAKKVARVHGAHNPRLEGLEASVQELADTLLPHVDEEEAGLFPALVADANRDALRAELEEMLQEHRAVGRLLADIRAAAEDYAVPEWACTSYRTLFSELEAMEEDVMLHVHLENNVLAPRFAA